MKKLLTLILAFVLCFGMTACSKNTDDKDDIDSDVSNNNEIEKTVDAAASKLGLSGGETTLYEIIGAKDGKQFNDGSVELYLFDDDSDEYKAIKDGTGSIEAAATNDGMVILTDDQQLIDKFKDLDFK